ncbi:hypothetical protein F4819DRAFT_334660 [Hypoxylon fuscum]|nr:hypothetical protein F4819DRAFT_334660 [Hypoxylon fuscum]
MAGFNSQGVDNLQALLVRMQLDRAVQNADGITDPADAAFLNSYRNQNGQNGQNNQGNRDANTNNSQDYYGSQSGADSPAIGFDAFPPPAPTPPSNNFSNNFSHSHHPTSSLGQDPIGTMPTTHSAGSNNVDQSTNLLNLLKFSGQGAQNAQSSSHYAPSHASSHASHHSHHSHTSLPVHGHGHGQAHGHAQSSPFDQQQQFDTHSDLSHSSNRPQIHAPVPIPADPQGLLATLMKGNVQADAGRSELQSPSQAKWNTGPPPLDTQAYLLNLLNQQKPPQNDQPFPSQAPTMSPQSANGSIDHQQPRHHPEYVHATRAVPDVAPNDTTSMPYRFGNQEPVESHPTKFEYNSPMSQFSQHSGSHKSARYDYNNSAEFGATSPQNVASKSSTPGTSAHINPMPTELPAAPSYKATMKIPSATSSPGLNLDHKRMSNHRSPLASPEHSRRRLDSSHSSAAHEPAKFIPDEEKNTETVSEAMTGLAEQADKEAQEALERAEIEEDLAEAAAKDIKAELAKEENAHVLEDTFSAEVAESIRDVIDDVAQGAVADSWESAEADEIVVIEDAPSPVKVYNFPMKPWISITVQETDEPRPQFKDECFVDIARLKKDFDQIDRNLVAATDSFIAFGMSKAGGLRVIRQDDGRDAKLFTDTKDRIFNIAQSTTSLDMSALHKESVIGTGISGTVYYVQVQNGDKSLLEDTHPEQYGFALPPIIISQEGGDSGGVLKTRARTSSTHPEFFAVGRGKVISIVWPSWITQNNVFKPGHDHVVDTERLYKECFLRISTGKAGKDFTFSQDDTTIVSLDKSGRVKFWDVRDLIAVDENSDPRYPMPARTSLEVKEPLMTLNTTPEGEKAWPTSVLLLDKQRPYQKGWALRYMIVGMKQNHTLQLWDLALGKPVQEFNLPHTKESDPVCSIAYHPPSGMIVVGHPSRNSIYFLHLSAPKYTIKGLSQVDYIQKLVAKDSSIPEPDATAVISGVREYSLDNRGVLRSLDMLVNPVGALSDESVLFELYAMHSKGVTGIVIHQSEVGWSKENKVLSGVDAGDVGLVKITKLKELPSTVISEPQSVEEHAPLPLRGLRSMKETPPPQLSSQPSSTQDQTQKSNENLPLAVQSERREAAGPATPANQTDKAEKKSRKKREKAAAAAEKLASENAQLNGTSQPSRNEPASLKHLESKPSASSLQSAMSQESIQSTVKQVVSGLSEKLTGVIASEFRGHHDKVNVEFQLRDEKFAKSQHVLLDKVSNVLNANVQAVLTKTITDQFEGNVVPVLGHMISKMITEQMDSKMIGRVTNSMQNQLQKVVPSAVTQALQRPEVTKAIVGSVAAEVEKNMENNLRDSLVATLSPIIKDTTKHYTRSMAQEVSDRTAKHVAQLEKRHSMESNKIDQLTALVTRLSDTVTAMSTTQSQFLDQLLMIQQQQQQSGASRNSVTTAPSQATLAHRALPSMQSQMQPQVQSQVQSQMQMQPQMQSQVSPQAHSTHSHSQPPAMQSQEYYRPPATTEDNNQLGAYSMNRMSGGGDPELQRLISEIEELMDRGDSDTAILTWCQQGPERQQEIFDEYIVKIAPRSLQPCRPLVILSAVSSVLEKLRGHLLRERVHWATEGLHILHETYLHSLTHPYATINNSPHGWDDPQMLDVLDRIMDRFMDRIQSLYERITSQSPTDSLIGQISAMSTAVIELKKLNNQRNNY